jgi:PAS domain S-box-containing protein
MQIALSALLSPCPPLLDPQQTLQEALVLLGAPEGSPVLSPQADMLVWDRAVNQFGLITSNTLVLAFLAGQDPRTIVLATYLDRPLPLLPFTDEISLRNLLALFPAAPSQAETLPFVIVNEQQQPLGLLSQTQVDRYLAAQHRVYFALSEAKLQHRIDFEALLTRISTHLVSLKVAAIPVAIQQALEDVAAFLGIERVCLFQYDASGQYSTCSHEWHDPALPGMDPSLKAIERQSYPWSLDKMRKGIPIAVPSASALPPEADHERQMMESLKIKSYVVTPMIFQGVPLGWLSYYSIECHRILATADIDLLQTLAALLASALARQQSESLLRETEDRFRHLVGSLDHAFFIYQVSPYKLLYISPAYEKLWGMSSASLFISADCWLDTVYPDDRPQVLAEMERRRTLGAGQVLEYRIIRSDGALRWIRSRTFATQDETGITNQLAGIAEDITEQKLNETVHHVTKTRLQIALETTHTLAWEWDLQTNEVRITGLLDHPNAPLTQPYAEAITLLHPDDRAACESQLQQALQQTQGIQAEARLRVPAQGETFDWRWFLISGRRVTDGFDHPRQIVGAATDIQERRQAEEALRVSEESFRRIFEENPIAIGITDLQGQFRRVNRSFCKLVGYSADELLQMNYQAITHLEDQGYEDVRVEQEISELNDSAIIEKRYISKTGQTIWVSITGTVIRNELGTPAYLLGMADDITERKRTEQLLRQATEEAQAASRAKDEFLAMISHEIRTPLNGILGMTSVLLDEPMPTRQRDLLDTIQASSEELLGIVNELLDFSKIESGQLSLEIQPFEIQRCLEVVVDLFRSQANAKGLQLHWDILAGTPQSLIGDVTRIRQVLNNLISNAVKFTAQGTISVQIGPYQPFPAGLSSPGPSTLGIPAGSAGSAGSEGLHLLIAVHDTGMGISPESLPRLFRPFSQADSSITRRFGGTGLGLVICDRLLHLMGGQIWVESHNQVGGNPPADWQLRHPNETGAHFYFMVAAETPSALAVPSSQSLRSMADAAAGLAMDLTSVGLSPASLPPQTLRILIVEDVAVNQQVALKLLERLGYGADVVGNGWEALDALQRRSYDLVFMDVQMPEMDGLEATTHLRRMDRSLQPWVVGMTAFAGERDRDRCLTVGMNDYVTKPIDRQELTRALTRYWQKTVPEAELLQGRMPVLGEETLGEKTLGEGTAGEETENTMAQLSSQRSSQETQVAGPLDPQTLINLASWAGVAGLQSIIETYLQESIQGYKSLVTAYHTQDWDSLARIAHGLHPASASLGALELSDRLKGLELAVKMGQMEEVPELWEGLEEIYGAVQQALASYLEVP